MTETHADDKTLMPEPALRDWIEETRVLAAKLPAPAADKIATALHAAADEVEELLEAPPEGGR